LPKTRVCRHLATVSLLYRPFDDPRIKYVQSSLHRPMAGCRLVAASIYLPSSSLNGDLHMNSKIILAAALATLALAGCAKKEEMKEAAQDAAAQAGEAADAAAEAAGAAVDAAAVATDAAGDAVADAASTAADATADAAGDAAAAVGDAAAAAGDAAADAGQAVQEATKQ